MTTLLKYLAAAVAVILIFAPHEFAHAYVAYKCGDATAKVQGRLTLNPMKHIDPVGILLCIATGFGWAKPVPIDPGSFRHYRRGMFFTAIAGVATNYVISFLAYPLYLLCVTYFNPTVPVAEYATFFLESVFFMTYSYGLGIVVFNLLPFNPLDGFRVVQACTRQVNPVHRFLKTYGPYILIILVLESFLCGILEDYTTVPYVKYFDILGYVHWFANNILGFPIKALWNTVFGYTFGIAPY